MARGWQIHHQPVLQVGAHIAGGELDSFACLLHRDFLATAMFGWERSDRPDSLAVMGCMGIEYGPARDLLTGLTGSNVTGVALKRRAIEVSISSPGDATVAVQELDRFVEKQMLGLDKLADVDAIVDMLHQGRAIPFEASVADIYAMDSLHREDAEGRLIPALFTGAGRYEDARRALVEYKHLNSDDAWSPRSYRRFVRQLERFLNAGGELVLPTTPARSVCRPTKPERRLSFLRLFAKKLPDAQAQQAAVEAVRAASKGKARGELRTLLKGELSQRGVSMSSQTVETSVDLLATEQEPHGKAKITWRALKALHELVTPWRNSARAHIESAPDSKPSWLELPKRAAYPVVNAGCRWLSIKLDPSAQGLLGRVAGHGLPGSGRAKVVDVWLKWDRALATNDACVNVHIGTQRVGHLGADVSERFRPAMEAAAERDEDPWTRARLSVSSGEVPYILELRAPNKTSSLS